MSLGAKPGSRLAFGDTSSGARSGTGSMTRLLSGLIGRGGIRAGAHGASAAVRVKMGVYRSTSPNPGFQTVSTKITVKTNPKP